MKSWQPASLAKYLNGEVILISEFVICDFMNPEIRITSTLGLLGRLTGCQDFISKNV